MKPFLLAKGITIGGNYAIASTYISTFYYIISPAGEGRDPKVPFKVFFSLAYLSMRSNESFQGECETLTLEHSEKSKMAAKMAAETKNHHNFTSI